VGYRGPGLVEQGDERVDIGSGCCRDLGAQCAQLRQCANGKVSDSDHCRRVTGAIKVAEQRSLSSADRIVSAEQGLVDRSRICQPSVTFDQCSGVADVFLGLGKQGRSTVEVRAGQLNRSRVEHLLHGIEQTAGQGGS
jgi:hypothetical protein